MSGQRFSTLGERFVHALELAGTKVLLFDTSNQRPWNLSVVREATPDRVELYLWAVTPGGKGRGRPNERRIQLTGVERFTLRAGVKTVLGGWSDEADVFAFWDVRRHLGFRAGSPSLQISLETLERAHTTGMATEIRSVREGQEVAVAVHPDYLDWYLHEYERIYDCAGEIADAGGLVGGSPEDERQFIDSGEDDSAQSRRHSVVSVIRTFRQARFRPMVLRAYNYRCCLTGVALRLVDAAHVVPVSDPTSSDEPRNGVALNPLLHRAYDFGLLALLPGGRTAINERIVAQLRGQRLDAGLESFRSLIPAIMTLPTSQEFMPPDEYFIRGLKARGWTESEISAA